MRARARWLAGSLVVLALVWSAQSTPSAFATFTDAKWPNGNVVFNLELGGGSGTLIDGSTSWNQVFSTAMATWNTHLNNIKLAAVNDSTAPRVDADGINVVFFSNTVYGKSFGGSTVAITLSWWRGTQITDADIIFNTAFTFNSYRGNVRSGSVDMLRVALHELGHSFGLDHPDDYGQRVTAVMNAIISNTDSLQSDDIAGAQSRYGGGVTSNTSFPPRNEPADFYVQLIVVYRDILGAPLSATYVDPEGVVIWLTEYARQRVGQCDHAAATDRTIAQITGTGGTLVCAITPAGVILFPPRNEGLLFMLTLDSTYRTALGRALGSSYVNNEGAVVWVLEYLRYRLNGCSHGDASAKVITQIRGGGIQPLCR